MSQSKRNNALLFPRQEEMMLPTLDKMPLAEYPRPQFKRDSYLSLNGRWNLAISTKDSLPTSFPLPVLVPYAVESPLSGVNHALEPDEILYYSRLVELPKGYNKGKILLHFEGVDQTAEVFVDGKKVGEHVGGYTPFVIELSENMPDFFTLLVKVKDVTDSSYHARGKQRLQPSGWFYSSSSGIYKPVWLESVSEKRITGVKFTPDYDNKAVKILVTTDAEGDVSLLLEGEKYTFPANQEKTIAVKEFHPWSPEDPYLYPVEISFFDDKVTSYFGLRKIEIKEVKGVKRIFLNDKPIFLSGLLDQGYYFEGNLTPSSYEDYLFDVKKTKEMGFNCLRVHVKTELPMFYYYADKEGLLLLQDFPNGGKPYDFVASVAPRTFTFLSKEKKIPLKKLGREDEEGKEEFRNEAKEYLEMTYNNPSVIMYTIFNEGWGEFEPSALYDLCKKIDPTRLYDSASGWYDADKSDFFSIHTYSIPDMKRVDKKKRCFIISEMGGVSYKVPEHSYYEKEYGHGKAKSKEELTKRVEELYLKKMLKQIKGLGLNATIYTELSDCETEYNGLLTYDRKVQKVDSSVLKKLNEQLYQELADAVRD